MKKTIVVENDNGKIKILDGIMKGALSFGYGISKYTLIFDSKKDAKEQLKDHPCKSGLKYVSLNESQTYYVNFIKRTKQRYFMDSNTFMSLEDGE